ncbi:hypothetical protein [uncultured Gordonia sp.]|uniref:hypothetical protein n=1 Tax=uncultured Gordonia sp. TaxID=198437 RepID=UPI002633C2DF|nr:hypothetical protein [uncultured Gordonia sp.]
MINRPQLFIGGAWTTPSTSAHHDVIEAATEKPLGTVALAAPADIDAAGQSAPTAFARPWRRPTPAEPADAPAPLGRGCRKEFRGS